MRIAVDNLRAHVLAATEDEIAWLSDYLSFEDHRLKHARGYKGDGRVRMLHRPSGTFPAGFLNMVIKACAQDNADVPDLADPASIEDRRRAPAVPDPDVDLSWLRDYQRVGVGRAFNRERGLLWLPTGSGKTEIAIGLAELLRCRWLFLVHRSTLMHQTADRFEQRLGEQAGRVGDGVFEARRFTVATFQTLWSHLRPAKRCGFAGMKTRDVMQLLKDAEGLIVDEAHTLPADSFWQVVMKTPSAYWRIGMSGTPLARGDRRSLLAVGALGPVIYRVKPKTLIDRGLLAMPRIRMVPVTQEGIRAPTWQGVYGAGVVRSGRRNAAIVEAVRRCRKPALVFVKEIKHGEALTERLNDAGIPTEFVWGTHSTARRKAAVRRLEHGDLEVLVCSVIFQEGEDIPELRAVICAAGGKSTIATLQRIGRGMRPVEGEGGDTFEVWDVDDRGSKMLSRHARARRAAYEKEGYEVEILDPLWAAAVAKKRASA